MDSDNNVFGRILDLANINITAGGSSSGKSNPIAIRGSILGVSTRITRSIRIPSLCKGSYSLRPTVGIVPKANQREVVALVPI